MTNISKTDRAAIKAQALSQGEKYRIAANGAVEIYGKMPNTNVTGWWFAGWKNDILNDLKAGK